MSMRCPRCGNTPPRDSYVCNFCGFRIRTEKIENFFLFKRYEAEWTNPLGLLRRLALLIVNPSKAFWDINHKRDSAPGYLILLFNAIIYGLFGLALFSHFQIVSIYGNAVNPFDLSILFGYFITIFLMFFVFGFIYYFLLFHFLTYFFIKGANYSIGFTEKLEERFGKVKEKEKAKLAEEASVFSIYKSGTLLQKQEANQYGMLLSAFTPFIITGLIKVLIILNTLPYAQINLDVDFTLEQTIFDTIFQAQSWIFLDILDAFLLIAWIPITMTIGIRELANSSTVRVYLSSILIGIVCSIVLFLLKPTILGLL